MHNLQSASGGALHVLEQETELLTAAGHTVDQLFVPAAEDSGMGAVAMGLAAVWNRKACAELGARIDAFRPDVVHVHTPFPIMSPAVFRVAHQRGCATVTTVHAYRYSCVGGMCFRAGKPCEDCVGSTLKLAGVRHRCYHDSVAGSAALTVSLVGHRMLGTFDKHVDRIVALTPFGRDLLIRDGYPADKIVVKPNTVPDPGPPRDQHARDGFVLHVGRLIEEKGIRTLLRAWESVDAGRELYIAGDGPLRHVVEEAAATNPSIHALGWCDGDTLADLQSRAAIAVTPSKWYEGGPPLVVLQSMAAGTALVTSDLANICQTLVEHDAVRTFRTGDAQDLAVVLNQLLADPDELARLGQAARALYDLDHTPAGALTALESIYAAALGTSAGPTESARQGTSGRP